MRNMCLSILTALVFLAATAVAQTTPSTPDQTGNPPSASSPSGAQDQSPQGTNSPSDMNSQPSGQGQTGTAQNPGYGNSGTNQGTKEGEKKLKGCLQSQGGQYMLETKNGKTVPLSGEGLSAHVGHEVAVHGMWGSGSMSGSSSSGMGNDKTFNVTSIDHISDTCGAKHSKSGASTTQPQ